MIRLTRLNGLELVVNVTHLATVEATPDTIVTLLSGEKLIVRETPEEVAKLAFNFYRRVGWAVIPGGSAGDEHAVGG